MNRLIVLLGPTGVGKTELCLRLAQRLHSPILNADSRQIFAEIPIGTAAPTAQQQQMVKHYFVGNHHLTDYYSASMFEQDALRLLDQLFHDPEHPLNDVLMSGGSMMYIDAVCNGIDDIPTVRDDIRDTMKQRLAIGPSWTGTTPDASCMRWKSVTRPARPIPLSAPTPNTQGLSPS
jgi:tRNA dimethylallyltransferase